MIIEINSSNKDLGYILNKNPASGLTVRGLRKGFIFGKFVSPLTYICGFEEGVNQDSFEKEGNYLIYKGYCSAEAALAVLTNLFDCLTKDNNRQYESSNSLNTITIKCIEVNDKNVFTFNSDSIKLNSYSIADDCNLVSLDFSNNGSLIDLIRYTCLFLYMQVVNDNVGFLQLDQAKLYANIIKKNDNIPFIIRHRFRGVLEQNMAKKIVPLLCNDSIKLSNIGRNENQRMAFVSQHIKYKSVLDIGCGPGKYIKVSKATKYIGVDIDEKTLDRAKYKAAYITNVEASFYSDWKEALAQLTEPTTVLLIEFIEHVERDYADHILTALVLNEYVNQILISTPNKDFNKYFYIDDYKFRFDDHLYELTEEEFKRLPGDNINWGDSVDSCYMTLYKNIEFKDEL